ncbi:MAG: hypothetical protein FJ320_00310 [SAR202 cluster bacterium]|nr:hypothetical protein [SAR202 cluster bacterium]
MQLCGAWAGQDNDNATIGGIGIQANENEAECENENTTNQTVGQLNLVELTGNGGNGDPGSVEQDNVGANANGTLQLCEAAAGQTNDQATIGAIGIQANENEAECENENDTTQSVDQTNEVTYSSGAASEGVESQENGEYGDPGIGQSNTGANANVTLQGCAAWAGQDNDQATIGAIGIQANENEAECENENTTNQTVGQANSVVYNGGSNGNFSTVEQDNVGANLNVTLQGCEVAAGQVNDNATIGAIGIQANENEAECENENTTSQGVGQTNAVEYNGDGNGNFSTVEQDNVGANANETLQGCAAWAGQDNDQATIGGTGVQANENEAECENENSTSQGVVGVNQAVYAGTGNGNGSSVEQDNVGANYNGTSQGCEVAAEQANDNATIGGSSNQENENEAECENENETSQDVVGQNVVVYSGIANGNESPVAQANTGANYNGTEQECGSGNWAGQDDNNATIGGDSNQENENEAECENENSTGQSVGQANVVVYSGDVNGNFSAIEQDNVGANANETSQGCAVAAEQANDNATIGGSSNQENENEAECENEDTTGQGVSQANIAVYQGDVNGNFSAIEQDNVGANLNETSQGCEAWAGQDNDNATIGGSSNQENENEAECENENTTSQGVSQANVVVYSGDVNGNFSPVEQDNVGVNANGTEQGCEVKARQESDNATIGGSSNQENENEAECENENTTSQGVAQANVVAYDGQVNGNFSPVEQDNVGVNANGTIQGCETKAKQDNENATIGGESNQANENEAECENENETTQGVGQANVVSYDGAVSGNESPVEQDNVGVNANGTIQGCEVKARQENDNATIGGSSNQENENEAECENENTIGQEVGQENSVEYTGEGTGNGSAVGQSNVGVNANGTLQGCEAKAKQENADVAIGGSSNQANENEAECENENTTDQTVDQGNTVTYSDGAGAQGEGAGTQSDHVNGDPGIEQDNVGANANETQQECAAKAKQTNVSVAVFGDSNQANENEAECENENTTTQGVTQDNTVTSGGAQGADAETTQNGDPGVEQSNTGANANDTTQNCEAKARQRNISVAIFGNSNQNNENEAECENENTTDQTVDQGNTVSYGGGAGGSVGQNNTGANANSTNQTSSVRASQENVSVSIFGNSTQNNSNKAKAENENTTTQNTTQSNTVESSGGAGAGGAVEQGNTGGNTNGTEQTSDTGATQENTSVAAGGTETESAP